MFATSFETVERFSPFGFRKAVEVDDEAMKEKVCHELKRVKEATEAMAQLDIDDVESIETAVENIVNAVRAVKRAKTVVKRNDARKNQYTDYMDIILNNTEVGGIYTVSHLMEELSEVVKFGRYRHDMGYSADMFRTVMDTLVEGGTFKIEKISSITVFTREK